MTGAALAALAGDREEALQRFHEALALDPLCAVARFNLTLLEDELTEAVTVAGGSIAVAAPILPRQLAGAGKVAILSFLFNWPSSGGGNVHTVELARFLGRAGYTVRHFYPRYAPWGINNVEGAPFGSEVLPFDEPDWDVPAIQGRFRQAVDGFSPEFVLIMDSWNFKPHLAEAMRGYPCFCARSTTCACCSNPRDERPSVRGTSWRPPRRAGPVSRSAATSRAPCTGRSEPLRASAPPSTSSCCAGLCSRPRRSWCSTPSRRRC
jgi:hypothetical protein